MKIKIEFENKKKLEYVLRKNFNEDTYEQGYCIVNYLDLEKLIVRIENKLNRYDIQEPWDGIKATYHVAGPTLMEMKKNYPHGMRTNEIAVERIDLDWFLVKTQTCVTSSQGEEHFEILIDKNTANGIIHRAGFAVSKWRDDMKSFKQFVYDAELSKDVEVNKVLDTKVVTDTTETTLNRIRDDFESDRAVAIVTAFKDDKNKSKKANRIENIKRNKQLAVTIKQKGYGYLYVGGHWPVEDGKPVEEDCILVRGNNKDSGHLKRLMLDVMKQYDQKAVLFKAENSEDILYIHNDETIEELGKFTPDKVAKAYTRLRGHGERTFVFESIRVGRNWIEKMASHHHVRSEGYQAHLD